MTPENYKRAIKAAKQTAAILGVVTMLTPLVLWVDSRYMHNDIANIRYIDLQISLLQKNMRDYQRLIDTGATVTAADETNYQLDLAAVKSLRNQRSKQLGIEQ